MEFMSQYDATIHYLPGENNCATDTLLQLPDSPLTIIAAMLPQKIATRFELEDALIDEICEGYIPGCADCQRNKSHTSKPLGPLHPLPVPDGCCDSIVMDFIGPLPKDGDFDMILTIMDCLGSDI